MIYDKENLFLDGVAVSEFGTSAKYSDVIVNTGAGDAYPNAFLAAVVTGAPTAGGALTVTLQTSDTEAFTAANDLASVTVPVGSQGDVVGMIMPKGCKKYLRLKLQGSAAVTGAGKITAGIVLDINQ